MLSATASLGLILLWDVDGGLTQIDKYLYSSEDYIKVSFKLFFELLSPTNRQREYLFGIVSSSSIRPHKFPSSLHLLMGFNVIRHDLFSIMGRCFISNIYSDNSKAKVTLHGQMLKLV